MLLQILVAVTVDNYTSSACACGSNGKGIGTGEIERFLIGETNQWPSEKLHKVRERAHVSLPYHNRTLY